MGCTSSTEVAAPATNNATSKSTAADNPHPHSHPHHHEKREKSLTGGTESMVISAHDNDGVQNDLERPVTKSGKVVLNPTCTIRYAVHTRQGRDPEHPDKPNQDSWGVEEHYNGSLFFGGVYDGHGPHGELCSQFVERRFPKLLLKELQHPSINLTPSTQEVQACLHKANVAVNQELHSNQDTNDTYSGTTSISVLINEHQSLTVANVGDSRAILGTQLQAAGDKLQAVPLSQDQTPYRKDEAARCTRAGAKIASFGQLNPKPDDDPDVEDPPRVWAPNGNYPGTAFTRSIGDAVAEQLGVTAEPELLTLKLSEKEKCIVLASDGIFDVLSNQAVMDVCYQHYQNSSSPENACAELVEKAYQEWLINDDCVDHEEKANYDDMTLICIFCDVGTTSPCESAQGQLPQAAPVQPKHGKRVRQKTLRNLEEMI